MEKKSNKHNICSVRMLSQQLVHNMMDPVKRKIHVECMYKMLNGIIEQNGMYLHKNENGPRWQFLVVSSLEHSVQ